MQLGIVGLGRMGAAMRERLRRGGHEVTGYDLNAEVSDVASAQALVEVLDAPRVVWLMAPAGDATEALVEELAGPARARRRVGRRREQPLQGLDPARRDAGRARRPVPRRRRVGRHLGARQRLLHHGRRRPRRLRGCRAGDRDPCAGGRLPARRAERRGPLREDDPQRHRVRPHAGLRRGLRPAPRLRRGPGPARGRGAVAARLRRAVVAARARRARARRGPGARPAAAVRRGLRRGAVDGHRGRRARRARGRDHGLAVRSLRLARRALVRARMLAALRQQYARRGAEGSSSAAISRCRARRDRAGVDPGSLFARFACARIADRINALNLSEESSRWVTGDMLAALRQQFGGHAVREA